MTEPAKNLAHGAQKVSQSSSPPAGVTRATGFGRAVTFGADKDEGALAAGGRDAVGLAGGRSAGLLTGLGRGRDAGAGRAGGAIEGTDTVWVCCPAASLNTDTTCTRSLA